MAQNCCSPSWIDIASAAGLWVTAAVALFGERLWGLAERPRLAVRRAPLQLSVQKTEASYTLPNGSVSKAPCYYCHLEVVNQGSIAAREVEVFLSGVHRLDGDAWVVEDRFIPEWLWWTTLRSLVSINRERGIYLPTLPPHARRYVDLAHVHKPQLRGLFDGEDRPGVDSLRTLLALDVAVTYLRAGHLLGPGRYKLILEVAAANAKPKAFEVEISHSGDWHDVESTMQTQGVTIGEVRQISSEAARVLAARGS